MGYGENDLDGVKVVIESGMSTAEYEISDAECFVYNTDTTLKVGTGTYNDYHNAVNGETRMIFNFDKVISIQPL